MLCIRSPATPLDEVHPVTIDVKTVNYVSTPAFMHPDTVVTGKVTGLHLIGDFSLDECSRITALITKDNIRTFIIQDMNKFSYMGKFMIARNAQHLTIIRTSLEITMSIIVSSKYVIETLHLINTRVNLDGIGNVCSLSYLTIENGVIDKSYRWSFDQSVQTHVEIISSTVTEKGIEWLALGSGAAAVVLLNCRVTGISEDEIKTKWGLTVQKNTFFS